MPDQVRIDFDQSLISESLCWYRNLQPLGEGRNAGVYLVVATSGAFTGMLFALKLFKRLSMPDRRERFLRAG